MFPAYKTTLTDIVYYSFRHLMPPTTLTELGSQTFHPDRENFAFGKFAFPVMARQLKIEDNVLRKRAAFAFRDFVMCPKHVGYYAYTEAVKAARALTQDSDVEIRRKISEAFAVSTIHALGRRKFLQENLLKEINIFMDDSDEIVRAFAHVALRQLSISPNGILGIIQAGLVPRILEKLKVEKEAVKILILDTLHAVCMSNPNPALDANGIETVCTVLLNEWPLVRIKGCRVLMDLCVFARGRDRACEVGALDPVIELLKDLNGEVREANLGALMMICVSTPGRYITLRSKALDRLIPYLDDHRFVGIRLNCLKVLTTLAEAPEGRTLLLNHLNKVKEFTSDPNPLVCKAAEKAVEVITWVPN